MIAQPPTHAGVKGYDYKGLDAYEEIFIIGMCLPAGPYVADDDVKHIVASIKEAIEN